MSEDWEIAFCDACFEAAAIVWCTCGCAGRYCAPCYAKMRTK